jgi:hypothetical protein
MGYESFGGQDVVESGVSMPGMGGLHEALAVDGLELPHGARFTLAVDVEVTKVNFEPVDKDDLGGDLRRVTVLRALNGAQINRTLVVEALEAQARKVESARAAAKAEAAELKGQLTLADAGGFCPHDRPVGECTVCPAPAPVVEPEAAEVDELAAARQANGDA